VQDIERLFRHLTRTLQAVDPARLQQPLSVGELVSRFVPYRTSRRALGVESSEDYDRGTKFLHYQAIAALREYVIVSHRERRIDHYRRLDTGQWLATAYVADGAQVELPILDGSIRLLEVYAEIDLTEGMNDSRR